MSALRKTSCKRGVNQRQNTFVGVVSAGVCLSVVLSSPMNVFWRLVVSHVEPCSAITFSRNTTQESADCWVVI